MPSTTIIKTIKSLLTGDTIYPVTKASAVYMNDSTSQSPSTAEGHITALDSKVGTASLNTTAQDLSAAINQHEDDISELNSNYNHYSFSQKVTANSAATLGTFTITRGKWLIISVMGLANTGSGVYNSIINERTVRCSATNGGGCINSTIFNVTENTYTITISTYSPIATTVKATVDIIKLNS